MTNPSPTNRQASFAFLAAEPALEKFGLKFSAGGPHISRTIMLAELEAVLASVPLGSSVADYREAILQRNVLGKATDSTRKESLRRLRELYALDEATPVFAILIKLQAIHAASLPFLAIQVAWARDPLLRATTPPILGASEGDRVETASLAQAVEETFPDQYSQQSKDQTARHAASSWTQSGHLAGRTNKIRRHVTPTAVSVAMAFFLGHVAGYHGAAIFSNPWCRLLDLNPDRAKAMGLEAHRAGLLNLRAIGEVVEVGFPMFAELLPEVS